MRIIFFIIFSTLYCSAQDESDIHEFKFYKNGIYKNTKKIKLYIIKNTDTVKCDIVKNKITIPKIDSLCSIIFHDKKRIYAIENVDFSKLADEDTILFGIEKNLENFGSTNLNNIYLHPISVSMVPIENFYTSKKVFFLSFNSKMKLDKNYRSYCRSVSE